LVESSNAILNACVVTVMRFQPRAVLDEILPDGRHNARAFAEQGEVEGEIHTCQISVAGKVKGNIHASESLEIKKAGVVLGAIFTPKLFVEPGGYFDGQCHMPTPEPEKKPAPHVL
jgi:hypothetical protein